MGLVHRENTCGGYDVRVNEPSTIGETRRGSPWEVFRVFLVLGLTSFGGPAAHLGYFRTEIVERRQWISDRAYADLVALCQFLPGPASSQVGFALGLRRAGAGGAIAAFLAFTLPSAALMLVFASGASLFTGAVGYGALAGLKIVAVAIVAQAVLGMARSLTPDVRRAVIALVAAVAALGLSSAGGQLIAIAAGIAGGLLCCRELARGAQGSDVDLSMPVSKRTGIWCLIVLALLLAVVPFFASATGSQSLQLFDAFTRSGALVFGGGHVVLPLLSGELVSTGWVSSGDFLAGYGAAQAVPGPLFSISAYLGAISGMGPSGILGAAIALIGIFLPGFLLLIGTLPFWAAVRHRPLVRAALLGANAAVVGVLAAALYRPVMTSAITGIGPLVLALVCFAALSLAKLPPWLVVLIGAAGGIALSLLEAL